MKRIAPICRTVCLLFGASAALGQIPAMSTSPAVAANMPVTSVQAGQIAQVAYSNGLLEVSADNSSLNQILREISRQTGMKVTGSVSDERVYGRYGPSTPARILADLLDGTGSNMLLRERASNSPTELILTPRIGGPTPPQGQSSVTATPVSASGTAPVIAPTWMQQQPQPGRGASMSPVEQYQAQQQTLQRVQQQQQQLMQQQHGAAH